MKRIPYAGLTPEHTLATLNKKMFDPIFFSVPIVNFDNGIPDFCGSGVLLCVDKTPFVVTAMHVLETRFKRIGIVVPTNLGWEIVGHGDPPIMGARALANEGDPQNVEYKAGLDLAVIRLEQAVAALVSRYYSFYDLRQNNPPEKSEWVTLSGFAASENSFTPETGPSFRGCCRVQCPTANDWEVRKIGGSKNIHFAIRLNKEKNLIDHVTERPAAMPKDIGGMSGSGVWAFRNEDNHLYPACHTSLLGIAAEECSSRKLIKVINIEYVWEPLNAGWGFQPDANVRHE
jgi:hypothetical protein